MKITICKEMTNPYTNNIMVAKRPERPKAHIVEKPRESIVIQLHHRRRGSDGLLKQKTSKSLTVYNLSFEEVYQRIRQALLES